MPRRPFIVLAGTVLTLLAAAASAAPLINEIRIDQVAVDVDEYFELAGDPGESLSGYWYLVIGDDQIWGDGCVEAAIDLSGLALGADGLLSVGEDAFIACGEIDVAMPEALNFEDGDNVTHLLVEGFTGELGDDLDVDDDGVLDLTPWSTIVDCLALIHTPQSGDLVYCGETLGPDGPFWVTHALRCSIGWGLGEYAVCELDSPGQPNDAACIVPAERMSWGELKSAYR